MGTSYGATTPPAEPRKGWFGRNWKWFVPSGCLTIIVLIAAFVGGILMIVVGSVKSSGAYTQALAQAQASPQVAEKIGRPVKPGWFVSGSVNVSGDSGDADISFPISGPIGKGKVYAVAKKSAGAWQFETLQVEVDGQADRIDLLQGQPAGQTAPLPLVQPAASAAGAAPETAAPAVAPAVAGGVIASAQYNNDPNIRCDLLEVKRVSGGALLVRWRLFNTGAKVANYNFDWPELYYTDPAENKKYAYLTDSSGARVLDMWWGDLPSGEQRLQWAKFPAPPASSNKVTVFIPKFAPFEDTPVAP
jgi:Cytochrome oxidase complex assembly protein 1